MPGPIARYASRLLLLFLLGAYLEAYSGAAQHPSPTNSKNSTKELQKRLNATYANRIYSFRNFYIGDYLVFTKTGSLVHTLDVGTWTLYSQVEIRKVSIKDYRVIFEGTRIAMIYNLKKKLLERYRTGMKTRIEIQMNDASNIDDDTLFPALKQIFLTNREKLEDSIPDVWKKFGDGSPKSAPKLPTGADAPRLIKKIEPVYTEEARHARHAGTVILGLTVRADGTPSDITLIQPLGLGLDEAAISAVLQWRFAPATVKGEPIDVSATVEVRFALF